MNDRADIDANLIRRVNVGDMLTRTAWRLSAKLALVDGDRRMSYGELNSAVNRFAQALLRHGYQRGDALALVSGNSTEFLIVYYACAKTGLVCVPVNLSWGVAEIRYLLEHSRATAVVVEVQYGPLVSDAARGLETVNRFVVAPGTGEVWQPNEDDRWQSFDAFLGDSESTEPECFVDDRDPLSYLYTSGTTSAPKGVVSSHLAVFIESFAAPLELGVNEHERAAAMMPLFHTSQLNGFATGCIARGGTLFLMRGFDPAGLLELIEREGITQIFGLPMMYRALMEHPDIARRDLTTLRLALYAMAPMPDTDLRKAIEVFDCDFALVFGQTEMNPLTTIFRPEHQLSHSGSVGTPVGNVQVAIMADDGTLIHTSEPGEIVYRGPHAMEGYLHNPQATAEAFAHGWFHSGDIGHFDADGLLWFTDRMKDVIKTGGENVASIEVEKALYEAEPRIQEVVVVGLPHERWSEAITAFVTPRPGSGLSEQDVIAAARTRLAGYKVPKRVVFTAELPHTATGKVQKNVLRNQYSQLYDQPWLPPSD